MHAFVVLFLILHMNKYVWNEKWKHIDLFDIFMQSTILAYDHEA